MTDVAEGLRALEREVAESFSGHKSAWTFETSGTANLGLGSVVLNGGDIKFIDPR